MATHMRDLLNDVIMAAAAEKEAERQRKECDTRLVNALAMQDAPLVVGGSVVIGKYLVKRPYETLSLVITDISNVDLESVVTV